MKQFFAKNIHFIYALVVATACIFYHGYSYGGGDQEEHLPLVFKMFDPDLYKYDYYVSQESLTFSIRYFYVQVVYAVSTVMGVESACLLLFFLCIFLISYSFVKITAHFTSEKYTSFFAPLIFLLFYNEWTVGGNYFVLPVLICSVFSMALCSFAFLQFFRKKYYFAAMCIGIAGLFQIVIAIHVAAILFILLLAGEEKDKIRKLGISIFLFLLFSAPMLFPVLKHHFFTHNNYDANYYARVLYYFRNPNHYLPSWFFPRDYARFFLLSFIGFSCAWLLKLMNRKQLFAMYFVVYAGAIVYFLLLEKFHFYPIGKIQWYRTTVWMTAFSSIFMVIAAGKVLNAVFTNIKFRDKIITPLLIAELAMILIIFNGSKIPLEYFNQRYELGNRIYSDMSRMHSWIDENTDKDAVILTEPGDVSFLCEAKRSMPIGYAAVIHEAFFMIPWYEKFNKIYGVNFEDINKITSAKGAAEKKYRSYKFEDKENLFNISYRINNVTTCDYVKELGPVVHREGDYILT
ncbi:MAG TPA: DUF6798 domain-containing protein, partial [Bacteroidia bacterium]|nr:DUF6798 domain-containing protein [Bacteroidia bacterium]